ncbi:MAG: porin family protein [bacterium]|nr:porin family protein [bacterium]
MTSEKRVVAGGAQVALWVLLFLAGSVARGVAEEGARSDAERLAEVEEKVEVLVDEIGRLESIFAVPEELALESFGGLGPAASKVYKRDQGLSIGGYGEIRLRSFHDQDDDDQDDVFDALRAVLYVGYKFDDKWVLNTEMEFEHAGTGGGGSVSTEFATVDYLWREEVNARAGLVLIPMGFVNEIHEPTFFFGAERPEVERQIMPSTWRENGAGLFGRVADRIEYRIYVVNGFDGSDFSSGGLRKGRQKGSEALANDFAFVGRIDVDVAPGLLVGGSVYTGQAGQEQDFTSGIDLSSRDLPDARTTIYELHAQYRGQGLSLRGLFTEAFIDEAGKLSRSLDKGFIDIGGGVRGFDPMGSNAGIANRLRGWYVEGAYNILPLFCDTKATLEPYFRYEYYDTQHDVSGAYSKDKSKEVDLYTAGLQFRPIPNVVFKVDYRHFDPTNNDKADQVQALVGYAF